MGGVDLLDASAVVAAIGRIRPSAVYHCAGAAHVGRSWDTTWETLATNVRATHYLLDALERTDTAVRVMIPSSALVYAPSADPLTEDHRLLPDSPYGLSKLAQEMLGERTNISLTVTIARSFNHFGPRQDPQFVASSCPLHRKDRKDTAKRIAWAISSATRSHRCPRHCARLPADPRAGAGGRRPTSARDARSSFAICWDLLIARARWRSNHHRRRAIVKRRACWSATPPGCTRTGVDRHHPARRRSTTSANAGAQP